jgi:hypothetical protein
LAKLDGDMPAMLVPDFFGNGGGAALRATGACAAAGADAVDLAPAEAGRLDAAGVAPPLAASEGLLGAGELPLAVATVPVGKLEPAGDCHPAGAVTATKLLHFGHSMICPTTARS